MSALGCNALEVELAFMGGFVAPGLVDREDTGAEALGHSGKFRVGAIKRPETVRS